MTGLGRRRWLALLALPALAGPLGAMAAVLSDAGKAALSRAGDSAVARGAAAGVVTLLLDRNGVIHEHAAGQQNAAGRVNMRVDSIFRIASMTKAVTSVAMMMLIEAGKAQLDDPVAKYLPGFANRRVLEKFNKAGGYLETRPARQPITLRQLLSHTSGLGYAFSDPTVLQLVNASGKSETELPLLSDPGERWTYSPGPLLIGQVVEKISGVPIDAYLRRRIFEPLGMSDSGFVVPAASLARVATVHHRNGSALVEAPNEPVQASPVRGDSGLYSTARDYGRFLRMLLNGGTLDGVKILNPASVAQMGENQIGALTVRTQPAALPAVTRPFPLGAGRDKFGLGFQIQSGDAQPMHYRSAGSLSWAGVYNTHFWLDPKAGIAAVVLMQVLPFYDAEAIKVLRDYEAAVYAMYGNV